ncbi:MAG: SDR family NAD(P)-dependent oxidoreductase [Saprospiraceae bacterium]|nr:SDR family NAD(P)-dependent oxidoreductase [Saprospiraceae bacterium]|tara:strand:- start:700 stop:1491 length:792 start_codon:yes stop_codon:yes gene_type:complete
MVVLITGVTGGLGQVIARILTEGGMTVYGTSRKADQTISNCILLPMDIKDSDSIANTLREIVAKEGRLDAVVNCVNEMIIGNVEETSVEEFRSVFEHNVIGAYNLCHQILPYFKKQNNGVIVNMSSAGGELAIPYMSAYTASKFALEAFSEALYHELRDSPIDVVIMQPVAMHMKRPATGNHLHLTKGVKEQSKSHAMVKMMANDTEASKLTPEKVANRIHKVLTSKKRPLRVRMDKAHVLSLLKRLAPQSLMDLAFKKILPV